MTLARIKARKHVDKYGHRVVARLLGTDHTETFVRSDDVKVVDSETPPH